MGLNKAKVLLAAERRTQDKTELLRLDRWSQACRNYTWLLPFFDLALVNWMQYSWSEPTPPELLDTVAKWMEMAEMVELIGTTTPIEIPAEREAEYAEAGMYSTEFLERNVRRFSAYMEVAEEKRPHDYQQVLKEQLDQLLANFRRAVNRSHESLLDSDDLYFIYEWRDDLHYVIYGIAKMQLESDMKRLRQIDAAAYVRELPPLDRKLKPLHAELKRANEDTPDDRAPESFWWRR